MCDETDYRSIFATFGSGNLTIYVTVVINVCVADSEFFHFVNKSHSENGLFGSAGAGFAFFIGSGGVLNVLEKSFVCFHFNLQKICSHNELNTLNYSKTLVIMQWKYSINFLFKLNKNSPVMFNKIAVFAKIHLQKV